MTYPTYPRHLLALLVAITALESARADHPNDPEVVELILSPCKLAAPPSQWIPIVRGLPDREVAIRNRDWLSKAWEIQKSRNIDPRFDAVLRQRPKGQDPSRVAWLNYMADRFRQPIEGVLDCTRQSEFYRLEPERANEQSEWGIIPFNGALCLIEPMIGWVIQAANLDEESVLENVPVVMLFVEDWVQSTDAIGLVRLDALLETVCGLDRVPNLGPALLATQSPYAKRGAFFQDHRKESWDRFFSPTEMRRIMDLDVPDSEVIGSCERGLQLAFRILIDSGDLVADNCDAWIADRLESPDALPADLVKSGISPKSLQSIDGKRLLWMRAFEDYDRFGEWHLRMHAESVVDAIAVWKGERDTGRDDRFHPQMRHQSSLVLPVLQSNPSPPHYWNDRQTQCAIALIFFLRDHVARHPSLPASLDELEPRSAIIDPITGHSFGYRRLAENQAELELAHYAGGIRKVYRLEFDPTP